MNVSVRLKNNWNLNKWKNGQISFHPAGKNEFSPNTWNSLRLNFINITWCESKVQWRVCGVLPVGISRWMFWLPSKASKMTAYLGININSFEINSQICLFLLVLFKHKTKLGLETSTLLLNTCFEKGDIFRFFVFQIYIFINTYTC